MSPPSDYEEDVGTLDVTDPPWFRFKTVQWGDGYPFKFQPGGSRVRIAEGVWAETIWWWGQGAILEIENTSQTNAGACIIDYSLRLGRLDPDSPVILSRGTYTTNTIDPQSTYTIDEQEMHSVFVLPWIQLDGYNSVIDKLRALEQYPDFVEELYIVIKLKNANGDITDTTFVQFSDQSYFLFADFTNVSMKANTLRRGVYSISDILSSANLTGYLWTPAGDVVLDYLVELAVMVVDANTGNTVKTFTSQATVRDITQIDQIGGPMSSFDNSVLNLLPQTIDISDVGAGAYAIRLAYNITYNT